METNLSFWWDLEKFSQKSVPSHTFLRCGDDLEFLKGLGKFRQKGVTSYTFFFAVQTILSFWWDLESFDKKLWPVAPFWQYRLSQVFDGTWKNFHKEVCPVTRCVRCGESKWTNLLWTNLKFWMGLRKVSTKMCAQLHVFAVQTILSFWWGSEKFPQNCVPSYTFVRCGD